MLVRRRAAVCVLAFAVVAAGCSRPGVDPELTPLRAHVAALEQRETLLQDVNAIERLQGAYGYYLDRGLWDEVANLFANDGTIELALDGVYVGKPRVREYLYALGGGRQGLAPGVLDEHLQVMPVISVAADGLTAKARWRGIVLNGKQGGDAFWGEGPYENEYVKEAGVWKIKTLHWYQALFAPYAGGWQNQPDPTLGKRVSTTLPPDRSSSVDYKTWPDTYVPPFSFPNPVSKYVASE